ncbi:MAG TPA: hypothetical protein VND93_19680 [Myxococcales bacterium]|nr:hypothetical protein [Myxococcales bacterium]
MLDSISTIPSFVTRLRVLPESLTAQEIRKCAHQFGLAGSGATEIELNEIDGRTVLLRAPDEGTLDRDWGVLVGLARELVDGRASHPASTFFREVVSDPDRDYFRPAELCEAEGIRRFDDGKPYFTGATAALLHGVDELFLGFAANEGAVPFFSEPIWEPGDLGSFGYSPQSNVLLRVSHLGAGQERYWQNATCDNIWKSLRGARLDGLQAFTALGTCCRNEPSQYFFLERMRTFRMREVVAAGSPEEITRFRERAVEYITRLAHELGLNGHFENANDPFFLAGDANVAAGAQLPELVKIELRLRLYDDKSLACASMNVHGDFFSRKLGFRGGADGAPVWTSCIAFGLERWAWAILVQFGPDPRGWPRRARELLDGRSA